VCNCIILTSVKSWSTLHGSGSEWLHCYIIAQKCTDLQTSMAVQKFKFIKKNQDGSRLPFSKTLNYLHVWLIMTKFGMVMHIGLPNPIRSVTKNLKFWKSKVVNCNDGIVATKVVNCSCPSGLSVIETWAYRGTAYVLNIAWLGDTVSDWRVSRRWPGVRQSSRDVIDGVKSKACMDAQMWNWAREIVRVWTQAVKHSFLCFFVLD